VEEDLLSLVFEQWASKEDVCPYVFHLEGKKISNFRKAWNRSCREAGLGYGYRISIKYAEKWEEKGLEPGPIYHDLRRTAVREMDRAGVSRKVAMMRTGHKTESVYNRYNIGTEADLKNAAQQLEAYRKGSSENNTEMGALTPEQQLLMLSFLLMAKDGTVTNTVTIGNSNEKGINHHHG